MLGLIFSALCISITPLYASVVSDTNQSFQNLDNFIRQLKSFIGNADESILSEEFIERINRKSSGMWEAGPNFDPETSEATIKGLMGVIDDPFRIFKPPLMKSDEVEDILLPTSFDAREHWPDCISIGEIRDQGSCGSCWAVAGAAAMTDRMCTVHGKPHARLSTEDLLTCCRSCGFGCNGGFPGAAWAYWQTTGIVTGGSYNMSTDGKGSNELCQNYKIAPCEHHVTGKRKKCSEIGKTPRCQKHCDDDNLNYYDSKIKAGKSYSISSKVEDIQRELLLRGPVEAAFTVFADFLHYKSGVYKHVEGKPMGGHAVRLIGWGHDDTSDTPYWLVANSWNYDWGENGLFKILRGSDHCGFESSIIAGY